MSAIARAIDCLALAGLTIATVAGAGPAHLTELLSSARPSPALRRLFTPAIAPPGAYEVYVTPRGLEAVVAGLRRSGPEIAEWGITSESPADAFGTAGAYEPWKVARLFGGNPVRVSRGSVTDGRRLVAAVTLLSPYPDPSMTRVWPGTMIIVFRPERWK